MAKVPSLTGLRALINKMTGATAKNIVSSTNASPTVLTVTAHGLLTGDTIAVGGHGTNTAANGARTAVKIDADTFSMLDMAGVAVNGNGIGGATGTVQRLTSALTPGDLDDLQAYLNTLPNKVLPDHLRASEPTIQSVVGL